MKTIILLIFLLAFLGQPSLAALPENEAFANGDPKVSWEQGQDGSIIRKEYFFSGQLKSEGIYKNNKLNGLYKEYFEDGQLYLQITFINGLENGPYKEYFSGGAVSKEANFKEGQFHGPYKEYYDDGTLFKQFTFEDGRRQGQGKIFHPNGQLQARLNFHNDQLKGIYEEYDEDGNVLAKEEIAEPAPEPASLPIFPEPQLERNKNKAAWIVALEDFKDYLVRKFNANKSPVYYFLLLAFGFLTLSAISYFISLGRPPTEQTLTSAKQVAAQTPASPKEYNFMNEESVVMYRRLLETVASGIFVADLKGNLVYANFALMKLLGLKARTDIFGFNINDQFIDTVSSHNRFLDELKKGEVTHYTFRYKNNPNEQLILSASGNFIYSDQGEAIGIQGVVYNVTEKAKLEEDLVIEKRKMDLMLELFERIDGIKDIDELVDYTVRGVTNIFGANRCSIMLLDKDNTTLVVRGAHGLPKEAIRDTKIKLGESVSGLVAKRGEAVVVKNIEYDNRFGRIKASQYLGRSFMVAPLEFDDQIIGVINVSEKKAEISFSEPFDEIDLRVLQHIATKVGTAIKNVELYTELNLLTQTDPITKIYNYRLLSESLDREIKRFKREKNNLCIFMMDLDSFKSYNDTFGHLEGDELLRNLGMILKNSMRETDIVCRYAGDEFCAILPGTNFDGVKAAAEKVIKAVGEFPFKRKVTISIGAAMYQEGMSKKDILSKADKALYQAKHTGKNQVIIIS